MAEPGPVHLVSDDAEVRSRVADAFAPHPVTSHGSLEEFRSSVASTGSEGGDDEFPLLLLHPGHGVTWTETYDSARSVCDFELRAVPFVVEEESGDVAFRPLSVGPSVPAADAASALDPDGEEWPPFELHRILAFIAKIRHDINNPLTAGMAENQLLLMDFGEEGEAGESLTTIHRQLIRIQGLVQELGRVRRTTDS